MLNYSDRRSRWELKGAGPEIKPNFLSLQLNPAVSCTEPKQQWSNIPPWDNLMIKCNYPLSLMKMCGSTESSFLSVTFCWHLIAWDAADLRLALSARMWRCTCIFSHMWEVIPSWQHGWLCPVVIITHKPDECLDPPSLSCLARHEASWAEVSWAWSWGMVPFPRQQQRMLIAGRNREQSDPTCSAHTSFCCHLQTLTDALVCCLLAWQHAQSHKKIKQETASRSQTQ